MDYARVIHEKERERERERVEKMDKCPNYQNNGYSDAHLKKKRK